MADRTEAERTLTRPELAAYLTELAREFDRDSDDISVSVGNKSVSLSPPEEVSCDVAVVERSSMLRGERETIEIELKWKP